jgi:hypothetical protein
MASHQLAQHYGSRPQKPCKTDINGVFNIYLKTEINKNIFSKEYMNFFFTLEFRIILSSNKRWANWPKPAGERVNKQIPA